ncbi:hypothetical protein J6590_087125 [Homalodisca vitripennis]|nr:hypothetical protein J6590_087125 [Homalodisca vitripennis]
MSELSTELKESSGVFRSVAVSSRRVCATVVLLLQSVPSLGYYGDMTATRIPPTRSSLTGCPQLTIPYTPFRPSRNVEIHAIKWIPANCDRTSPARPGVAGLGRFLGRLYRCRVGRVRLGRAEPGWSGRSWRVSI